MQDAVRRECAEELGAIVTVGQVVFVAYQDEPAPGAVQRFFLCRLDSIDDATKTGHEFRESDRGSNETVRVVATDATLSELRPAGK